MNLWWQNPPISSVIHLFASLALLVWLLALMFWKATWLLCHQGRDLCQKPRDNRQLHLPPQNSQKIPFWSTPEKDRQKQKQPEFLCCWKCSEITKQILLFFSLFFKVKLLWAGCCTLEQKRAVNEQNLGHDRTWICWLGADWAKTFLGQFLDCQSK